MASSPPWWAPFLPLGFVSHWSPPSTAPRKGLLCQSLKRPPLRKQAGCAVVEGGGGTGDKMQVKQKQLSQGQDVENQGQKIRANMDGASELAKQPCELELSGNPAHRS